MGGQSAGEFRRGLRCLGRFRWLAMQDPEPVNRRGAWRLAWDTCANPEAMTAERKARKDQWGCAETESCLVQRTFKLRLR